MITAHESSTSANGALAEVVGETTIVIAAPTQTVYAYLLDFTRHPEWVANVSKVTQVTAGNIGVGTVFQTQESAPPVAFLRKLSMMRHFIAGLISGTKPYSEAEITALEPGHRIAWKAGLRKGAGWFNRAEWEFILQPHGEGTQLVQRFRYLPQTETALRMVGAAGEGGIELACAVSLRRLKAKLEQ